MAPKAAFDEFAAFRGRELSSRSNRKTTSYYAMGAEDSTITPEEPMTAALRRSGSERKRKVNGNAKEDSVAKRLKTTASDGRKAAIDASGETKVKARVSATTKQTTKMKAPEAAKSVTTKMSRRDTVKKAVAPLPEASSPADAASAILQTAKAERRQDFAPDLAAGEGTSVSSEASSATLVAEPRRPTPDKEGNAEVAASVVDDNETEPVQESGSHGNHEETNEAMPALGANGDVNVTDAPVTRGSTMAMNDDTTQDLQAHVTTTHEADSGEAESGIAEGRDQAVQRPDTTADLTHAMVASSDDHSTMSGNLHAGARYSSSPQANEELLTEHATTTAQESPSSIVVLKLSEDALPTLQKNIHHAIPHSTTLQANIATELSEIGRPKEKTQAPSRFGVTAETSEVLESPSIEKVVTTTDLIGDGVPEVSGRPLKRARRASASNGTPARPARLVKPSTRTKATAVVAANANTSETVNPPDKTPGRTTTVPSKRRKTKPTAAEVDFAVSSEADNGSSFDASEGSDHVEATNADLTPPKKTVRSRASTAPKPRRPRPQTLSSTTRRPVKSKQTITTALLTPPSSQLGDATLLESVDPEKLAYSRALTHREPIGSKPQPAGQPEVWAHSRQALCETVPYFKKPQGGCHQNDGHVYAFLFDGVGHCREYMDSEVIISRAGGGMEQDSTGGMVQGKNQSMKEAQVVAMLNDTELQNPLIVICGNKNSGSICAMPHKYCVLGWFKSTMVWPEKTTGKGSKAWITIKYRMEWMTGQGQPWHAPKDNNLPERGSTAPALRNIYLEGWLCLNAACEKFWTLPNGEDAPAGKLEYNPAFLHERTSWPCEEVPYSIRPPLPDLGKALGDDRLYITTRGVVCPECGRCNQRYLWKGWRCDKPACLWQGLLSKHDPIMPASLHSPWQSVGDGPSLARNKHLPGVHVEISYAFSYKIYTYTFTGIDGRFVHAVANKRITAELHGPDDMLREMQIADMGLERRRFGEGKMSTIPEDCTAPDFEAPKTPPRSIAANTQLLTPVSETPIVLEPGMLTTSDESQQATQKGTILDGDFMTAFSMNYGMPYKFVATGGSQPFENAPWPVRACRSRLNWAAKEFLLDVPSDADFNEELIFAYMEGQKIDYHDDGEEGLGPRIATLSLGGKAQMHLRMKAKHFNGCSKTGVLMTDRPLPGSTQYKRRIELLAELDKLSDTDKVAYKRRLKEVPSELGLYEKRNKTAPDLVTVTLNHGDIILMDGYQIQNFLEHKVVPANCLRFALTCRTVLEHHLKEHEKPAYEVKPDDTSYRPLVAR
ncbi:hypothetical protein LTS14_004461 [Recurvomyces mirabilis]|uniref:uncharacterized protein n=1 Tax=Recurvomyces mirabilis TaxID=574656 RepID=UPI002DDF4028|nr:hypothetical protein LTS14_004461 [Recurvomyces mirabilis]